MAILDHLTQGVPVVRFIFDAVRGVISLLPRRRRKLSAQEILAARDKWRPEFQKHIAQCRLEKLRTDVIVNDVRRMDEYPDAEDKSRGISSWFRVGLADTYHKGIQLILNIESLKFDEEEQGWRYPDKKNKEEHDLNAFLIGFVPFEFIETVNWNGDEYYGFPHLFIHFEGIKRQPYERIAYAEKRTVVDDWIYYHELADFESVQRLSKRKGIGRYDLPPELQQSKPPWWKRLLRKKH